MLLVAFLAYVGSFCVLLFSQSRGAWLSFLIAVPLAIVGYSLTRGPRRRPLPWQPLLLAAVASVLLLVAAHRIFAMRFDGAHQMLPSWVESMLEGKGEVASPPASPPDVAPGGTAARLPAPNAAPAKAQPASPTALPPDIDGLDTTIPGNKAVGIRVLLYRMGMERFLERPWLGWGLDTVPVLIERAQLPTGERFVHLHNAYLDALVGMGLIGGALLFAVFALLMRELWLAWRTGIVSTASFWGMAGCVGIVLIANNFDSLMWRFEYSRAPLGLIFGCCMAYGLMRERRAREG
nr:O-antigen ligase family protein [Lysobacter sp. MMG2]